MGESTQQQPTLPQKSTHAKSTLQDLEAALDRNTTELAQLSILAGNWVNNSRDLIGEHHSLRLMLYGMLSAIFLLQLGQCIIWIATQ